MEITADIHKITFKDKEMIEQVRSKYGHNSSSHAFASLYLWQNTMHLSLEECEDDFFVVKCNRRDKNMYFFPCGNEQKTYDFISRHISDKSFSLCYVRKCDMEWLCEKFPNVWDFCRADESDEYICDVEEYISLKGSKFSEIRRKIRKTDREYDIAVRQISDETIEDAINVERVWYSEEHHVGTVGFTDDMVAELALDNRKELDLNGIVLYADNVPVSVFAGFALSDDTIDVLVGKTTPNAPKGIAYYALREYLHSLRGKYVYCNNEEDLGIEGIRQMKNSLCPCCKAEMWEAVLK